MFLCVLPSVTTQVDAGVQMTHSVSCVQLVYSSLEENVFQTAPLMTQESKNEVCFLLIHVARKSFEQIN